MSPTPDYDQVKANLSRTGGRLSSQWNEILRILREVLPPALKLANQRWNLDLPQAHGFVVDGEKAPNEFPWVSVASNHGTLAPFTSGFVSTDSNLVIHFHFAGGHQDRFRLDQLADLACIARACLYHYVGAHGDGQGRLFWDQLIPTAITLGPATTDNAGVALHYNLTTYPNSDCWETGEFVPVSDPTPDMVLGVLPLCGGRMSLVRSSILDICKSLLPQMVAGVNSQFGLSLKPPKSFQVLGEVVAPKGLPSLVVGTSCSTEAIGVAGKPIFMDRVTATLYCLHPAGEDRYRLLDNSDWGHIAQALLLCYEQGYTDGQGRTAWNQLLPTTGSLARLPQTQLSGTTLGFDILQGPCEERWQTS